MKILVADDEPLARQRLLLLLERIGLPGTEYATACNGQQVVDACRREPFDLVLLDIRMPEMDGIEAARELSLLDNPPPVVFATAYDQHALDAFEASAVDYLLKPVRQERLQQALDKARVFNQGRWAQLEQALHGSSGTRQRLTVTRGGEILSIPVGEIRCFRADHKYVELVTAGAVYLTEESLKQLEMEFAGRFLRVHRNALAALSYIRSLEVATDRPPQLWLEGLGEPLAVSRRHLASLRNLLKQKT